MPLSDSASTYSIGDTDDFTYTSDDVLTFTITGDDIYSQVPGTDSLTQEIGPFNAVSGTFDTSGSYNLYNFNLGDWNTIVDVDLFTLSDSDGYMYYIEKPYSVEYASDLSLLLHGSLTSYIYVKGPGSSGTLVKYPDFVQLVVNGSEYSSWMELSAINDYYFEDFPIEIPRSGITSIGFRFKTDGAFSTSLDIDYGGASGFPSVTYNFGVVFGDAMTIEAVETPPYMAVIHNIFNAVTNLPANIYNFFFSGVDPSEGEQVKEDMSSKLEEADKVQQEIEEGLEKPAPEEIVPDITVIVDQTDEHYVQYMDILSGLLSNTMITNLLLLVVSMAFVSYVLFGKKG